MFLVLESTIRFLIHPFWKRCKLYVLFRHLKKEGHSWWKIILSKLKCIFPFLAAKSVIWYYYSFNEISCYHQEGGESSHLHKFPKGGCEHNAHKFYQITLPTLFCLFKAISLCSSTNPYSTTPIFALTHIGILTWHVLSDTKSLQFSLRKSARSATHLIGNFYTRLMSLLVLRWNARSPF